jgi:hypothetical protein
MPYCQKVKLGGIDERTQYYDTRNAFWDDAQNGRTLGLCDDGSVIYSNPQKRQEVTWVDDVTKYYFYYSLNNGHPCIFIRFTAIHEIILNNPGTYFVCLEVKNKYRSKTKDNRRPRNYALSVFLKGDDSRAIDETLENITYIKMENIELNKEYCIYIKANDSNAIHGFYAKWMEKIKKRVPSAFENDPIRLEIDIRPSIRNYSGKYHTKVHTYLKDFLRVSYLPETEISE